MKIILCLALLFIYISTPFSHAGELFRIKGDGFNVKIWDKAMKVSNAKYQDVLLISSLNVPWSKHKFVPVTAKKMDDNSVLQEYKTEGTNSDKSNLTVEWRLEGKTLTGIYTLTIDGEVVKNFKLGGAMVQRTLWQGKEGEVKKGDITIINSEGNSEVIKNHICREMLFKNAGVNITEIFTGNPKWHDRSHQHIRFKLDKDASTSDKKIFKATYKIYVTSLDGSGK